MLAAYRIVILC